ncbi:leucine-rich repeat-containing protein 24-like [Daktulosphaira vitifoliae]|uniref:leucine-rich repeat-containing protein 24-like n=1 Tax=Daktulosphaira vitifoliae TaxID=58002 RepID=UPI0021AADACE|nr:leucine-rich repeat-containing protein 24-like [Daktulosphaira vitifoliae]
MPKKIILYLTVVVVMFTTVTSLVDTCQEVCSCKWKGGKQSVECKNKSLITIPDDIDGATQVLDVSGNNFQILSADTFYRAGLLNLQRVYMSSCRIGQIDIQALHGLKNLIELDLSKNMLTSVPSATFQNVPLLRELSLAKNPIQKLDHDAFRHCAGLVVLDLSGCELRTVAATAFVGIQRLENLKLGNNRLTELMASTIDTLNKVQGVELQENPWHCDCNMRSVKMWLTKNNIPTFVDPSCSTGPGHVANKTFSSLNVDDFACQPHIQHEDPTVEAATGDNASVSCRVHSIPEAKVSWYWNGRPLANNSAFGPFQRVFMTERGPGHSLLVLTNVQPSDSGLFLCVAENRAGRAEANFTLVVTRLGGLAFLANGQVAGLSVFLVFLIVTILLVIVYLLVRIKRLPPSASSADGKHRQPIMTVATATPNGTAVKAVKQQGSLDTTSHPMATNQSLPTPHVTELVATLSRRPKLTELAFTTDHYEAGFGGSVIDSTGGRSVLYHSQPSNPDLIADAPSQQQQQQQQQLKRQRPRSGSGEYHRATDDDGGLYSPSFWASSDSTTTMSVACNDRTPIIERSPPLPPPQFQPIVSPTVTVDPKAASLRVWKHGVQVMPPLSALKRALNKGSPDEGYQEGCGTDV